MLAHHPSTCPFSHAHPLWRAAPLLQGAASPMMTCMEQEWQQGSEACVHEDWTCPVALEYGVDNTILDMCKSWGGCLPPVWTARV